MASGLARNHFSPNVRERTNIQWYRLPSLDGSISGKMLGSFSNGDNDSFIQGVCHKEIENKCVAGKFHSHPKDSETHYLWTCRNIPHSTGETPCDLPKIRSACPPDKKEPHYKAIGDQCVPSCGTVGGTSVPSECQNTDHYNIQMMKAYDVNTCCRRTSKTICPEKHYKKRTYQNETNCFPSCGAAAYYAGYGHYGPDKIEATEDDPHVFSSITSCEQLNVRGTFGNKDWKNFTFYDPYRLKYSSNRDIFEVIDKQNTLCCVRGEQGTSPVQTPHPEALPQSSPTPTIEEDHEEECFGGVVNQYGEFCDDFSP